MDLQTLLDSERNLTTRLAEHLGTSVSYVSQMAAGSAPISPARAVQIEQFLEKRVTRKDLRPHDWHQIWPELVEENPGAS
jgi:DNA-binding transcriptional regulator YdaS (Cro superfamily)